MHTTRSIHRITVHSMVSLRSYRRLILVLLSVLLAALLLVLTVLNHYGLAAADLFRDPLALTDSPAYLGSISQLGLLLWATAIGSLLTLLLSGALRGREARCAGYALLVTILLTLDDAYLLHENVALTVWKVPVFYLIYLTILLGYLLGFTEELLRSPFALLLIALGLLAASLLFDAIPGRERLISGNAVFLIEDGLKLGGILFWTAYHLVNARRVLGTPKADARAAASDGRPLPQLRGRIPSVPLDR